MAPRRPLPDPRHLTAVLRRHGDVVPLRVLLEAGFHRHEVAYLLRRGLLVRPRVGWYAGTGVPQDGLRAVRVGGVLGCVSAATELGIATPEGADAVIHVSLDEHATRQRRSDDATTRARAGDEQDVRWHWERRMHRARGFLVEPADAILQMAACVPPAWLTAAIDSAIATPQGASPLVSPSHLALLRDALPRHLRPALDRADPACESPAETMVRLGLEGAGLRFRTQVWLTGEFRADFVLDGWLVIEVDGRQHATETAFARDRERDAVMAWYGHRVLRFTYDQVVNRWPWVLDVIRRVLAEGSPRALAR